MLGLAYSGGDTAAGLVELRDYMCTNDNGCLIPLPDGTWGQTRTLPWQHILSTNPAEQSMLASASGWTFNRVAGKVWPVSSGQPAGMIPFHRKVRNNGTELVYTQSPSAYDSLGFSLDPRWYPGGVMGYIWPP